jgi:hypothetical protein
MVDMMVDSLNIPCDPYVWEEYEGVDDENLAARNERHLKKKVIKPVENGLKKV